MNTHLLSSILPLVLFFSFQSPAYSGEEETASIDKLAPRAAGLWLAEVVKIVPYDERPSDGTRGVRFTLKKVRGSGQFHEVVDVITGFGGHRAREDDAKSSAEISPAMLKQDQQYWFAFASVHEYSKYPLGVIDIWKQGNPNVEMILEGAVRGDAYRWSPQYDPATGLTHGRRVLPGEKKQWRIRVEKEGKVLWEKTVPGTMSNRYFSWKLDEFAAVNFPGKVPPGGKLLVAETATRLAGENEYGLPPGMVYVQTVYDPETGVRLIDKVSKHQEGSVVLLIREYDARTGEILKEE